MNIPLKTGLSVADYLDAERFSEQRHEYYQGEIFAMAGASPEHNQIVANALIALGVQLRQRPCRVWANDMRVRTEPNGLYTYPDLVAFCGDAQYAEENTLVNPTVIIEVLSKSTEAYDRGDKFDCYQQLATLREYLLISQHKPRIERFVRQTNKQWLLTIVDGLAASVRIDAIDCDLRLADIYDKIDWPEHDRP